MNTPSISAALRAVACEALSMALPWAARIGALATLAAIVWCYVAMATGGLWILAKMVTSIAEMMSADI